MAIWIAFLVSVFYAIETKCTVDAPFNMKKNAEKNTYARIFETLGLTRSAATKFLDIHKKMHVSRHICHHRVLNYSEIFTLPKKDNCVLKNIIDTGPLQYNASFLGTIFE